MHTEKATVIGGGLAGSEAAWQLAERGFPVDLYEMRPGRRTPAHHSDRLAELVCSNSLGSLADENASALLKAEMRLLGSLIIRCALASRVPAGNALAVDRQAFAQRVTAALNEHPRIRLIRQEVPAVPSKGLCIIATGPLTSDALADSIAQITGEGALHFFDAASPILTRESVDMSLAFEASRYGKGDGAYINCPLTRQQYEDFYGELIAAERVELKDFEKDTPFFEACLPVEVIACRGIDTLRFGPMKPVGLIDPSTGRRPYAVVQLRQDNAAADLYNMVGFQTNLKWPEQKRVFKMIPALSNAEFVRLGVMHRNTYLNSPLVLEPTLQCRACPEIFFAGQLTGVEGYSESAATGLLAALNASRLLEGESPLVLPQSTMLGALVRYITNADPKRFQPINSNWGILETPPALMRLPRDERRRRQAARAQAELTRLLDVREGIC